jgi:hypothetical protein
MKVASVRTVSLAALWLLAAVALAAAPVSHEITVDGHPLRIWE